MYSRFTLSQLSRLFSSSSSSWSMAVRRGQREVDRASDLEGFFDVDGS